MITKSFNAELKIDVGEKKKYDIKREPGVGIATSVIQGSIIWGRNKEAWHQYYNASENKWKKNEAEKNMNKNKNEKPIRRKARKENNMNTTKKVNEEQKEEQEKKKDKKENIKREQIWKSELDYLTKEGWTKYE